MADDVSLPGNPNPVKTNVHTWLRGRRRALMDVEGRVEIWRSGHSAEELL